MLRLHDSVTGEVAPLPQRDEGVIGMYVCGPTVYDHPHVGHGRFTLVWDVIRRYLEWSGVEVRFVQNVTDIDDKIIRRAAEEDRSTDDVAAEYEQA
ncbi:MAG TPA: cysteine--tRNA ligase, partial [Acidimicrobiales bacterium]